MNTQNILKLYDDFCAHNRNILLSKGADYAMENNRLKNLMSSEIVNVPPTYGVLVRMMDKITRAANLLKQEAQVKDESIEDTLRDLSNYTFLLYVLCRGTDAKVPNVGGV